MPRCRSSRRDLTRHLADEPVIARPPQRAYRVQKFVRRNRLAVTAASMVALAVIAGLMTSSVLYVRAERARTDADRQRGWPSSSAAWRDRQSLRAQSARRDADQQRTVADDSAFRRNGAERGRASSRAGGAGELPRHDRRGRPAAAVESGGRGQVPSCRGPAGAPQLGMEGTSTPQSDSSLARIGSGGGAPTSIPFTPDGSRIVWVSDVGFFAPPPGPTTSRLRGSHRPAGSTDQPQSVIAVSTDGSKYVTAAWMTPVFATLYLSGARDTGRPGAHQGQHRGRPECPRVRGGTSGPRVSAREEHVVGPSHALGRTPNPQREEHLVGRDARAPATGQHRCLGAGEGDDSDA